MKNNYLFKSKQIGFRLLTLHDLDDYQKLDTNPLVRKFFPAGTIDVGQIKQNIHKNINFYTENGFGVLVAVELSTGAFIGRCGFGRLDSGEIEVGYVFLPEFWGKGYATEALKKLLEWAKENIRITARIVAYTPYDHVASIKVMQKAGMTHLKHQVEDGIEHVYYSIDI